MFGFIKNVFVVAMIFFNLSNLNSLERVSMNNQECKTKTKIININIKIANVKVFNMMS